MKACFIAGDAVWDEAMGLYKPWCNDVLSGVCMECVSDYTSFAGNIFVKDQATLDEILGDNRTDFGLPIDVDGDELSWANADQEVHPSTFGKIVAWIAQNGLMELGPGMKTPPEIAWQIMKQLKGDENIMPLKRFRIRWG